MKTRFAAPIAAILAATPASAEMVDINTSGPWKVAGGKNQDDQRMCAMLNAVTDNRIMSIKVIEGVTGLIFQMGNPGWHIPEDQKVPVTMTIDGGKPWTELADGKKSIVQFVVDNKDDVQRFVGAFGAGNYLRVAFPSGSEQPWNASLLNSNAALKYFSLCVATMVKAAGDQGSEGDTQPFGQ